jgi:hypothetical protein
VPTANFPDMDFAIRPQRRVAAKRLRAQLKHPVRSEAPRPLFGVQVVDRVGVPSQKILDSEPLDYFVFRHTVLSYLLDERNPDDNWTYPVSVDGVGLRKPVSAG